MNILGAKVDNLTFAQIIEKIIFFLNEQKYHQIATINPEFILESQKNPVFKNILNQCDLNVADGIGIRLAFWKKGEELKCRLAGADLLDEILRIADRNKFSIFLVVNKDGLSLWEEIAEAIKKNYPNLEINGANIEKNTKYQILDTKYQIVFCNFGAPYQEIFLHSLKEAKNDKIRLAMGVGGSFDYLTGKIKRAPKFMQNFGLEWLWRLIQQPSRLKRMLNAVIIFPLKIMVSK